MYFPNSGLLVFFNCCLLSVYKKYFQSSIIIFYLISVILQCIFQYHLCHCKHLYLYKTYLILHYCKYIYIYITLVYLQLTLCHLCFKITRNYTTGKTKKVLKHLLWEICLYPPYLLDRASSNCH